MASYVDFVLLGAVDVRIGGHRLDIGYPRQRCALAALLIDANRVVAVETLAARLWGDQAPASARNVIAGFMSRLRQALAAAEDVQLVRRGGGYAALVDPETVDLYRFRRLLAEADCAGEDSRRSDRLEAALALWQGTALNGLTGSWCDTMRQSLTQERLGAQLAYHDVQLRLGRHVESLPRMHALATEHPLDERLAGQLILAAYRSGDQAAAIESYQHIRVRLAEELGVDPGPQLRELYQQLLRNDPALAPPRAAIAVAAQVQAPTVPAQLPLDVAGFTGREPELARLDELLGWVGRERTAVVVAALSGTAGIGKTALAVHWAHRAAERFPDGQLYLNLRGFDPSGQAVAPAEAVRRFLEAFGVPPERVPSELDARVDLYRSLLSGRRMLLVLDNAASVEQIRPLLPGSPGCLVLVTSRTILTGLVAAEGAQPIALDLLTDEEATALLRHRIGARRLAEEPEAAAEIIGACARLPLALAVAAAHAATRPQLPLSVLAGQLRDTHARMDALTGDEPHTDIRRVFSWSYRALSPLAAGLFRLLGLHPGPDLTAPAAAGLTALPLSRVRSPLDELVRANLLTEHVAGRYAFHDLLRAYAAELAEMDSDDWRRAAVNRLLDHYLHSLSRADRLFARLGTRISLTPPRPGVVPEEYADRHDAIAWFTAETSVLIGAVGLSADAGFHQHAWQFAWLLHGFLTRRGRWSDNAAIARTALAAADRLGDPIGMFRSHRLIAATEIQQGRFPEALANLRCALELCQRVGDLDEQAGIHLWLAEAHAGQGDMRLAFDHNRLALDLFRATADELGEAFALNSVGWCHIRLGEFEDALDMCGQALELFDKLGGDDYGEAATWDTLGDAHHHLGDHTKAITCYRRALEACRENGDRYHEAMALDHIGDAHHAAGDRHAAHSAWRQALAVLGEMPHPAAEQIRAKLT